MAVRVYFLKSFGVELFQKIMDLLVQFFKTEELTILERRQYPTLYEQNPIFRSGLVLGSIRTRRYHRHSIMLSKIEITPIDIRLIFASLADSRLQVAGDHHLAEAPKNTQSLD